MRNDSILYTDIDRWYLHPDCDEVINLFYNSDSVCGGQYVENHISYADIKEADEYAKGDTDKFFDYIATSARQYLIDKGTDEYNCFDNIMQKLEEKTETGIEYAIYHASTNAYYIKGPVLFGNTGEVMQRLLAIATAPTMDNPCGIPPRAMTEEEYLGIKGCGSVCCDYAIDKLRCNRDISSDRGKKRFQRECDEKSHEYHLLRESEKLNYDFLLSIGILRDKTPTEKSLCKAHGHPDNESTQAARRMLDKRGIDWETGEKKSVKYIVVCCMNREIYLIQNAETKTDLFDSLDGARKAMLDDVVSTYNSITEKDATIDELMQLFANTHYDSPVEGTIDTNHNYAWMNFDLSDYDAYVIKILEI